ncbi:MAG: hypothetical protein RSA62_07555, partial [Oscillospiraceae bacterium]
DGHTWIVGRGFLWSWYAPELVKKIASQGSVLNISIETLIEKFHMEGDTEVEEVYEILGTTILGDGVAPAVVGASIKELSEIRGDFEKLKLRAAAFLTPTTKKAETNPKANKNNKGVKQGYMNKTKLAELQAKFAGYQVLAVSDDGMNICLLSDKGLPCGYTFTSREDMSAVVPERIAALSAAASFRFDDKTEILLDVCEITDVCGAQLVKLNAELASATGELATLKESLKNMEEAEDKRRIQSALGSIKAALNDFNATRPEKEKVDSKVCTEIEAKINKGEFSKCFDAEGKWNGDERACTELFAACAKAVKAFDAAAATRNNKVFVWESQKNNSGDKGSGIEDVLAFTNK